VIERLSGELDLVTGTFDHHAGSADALR